MAEIVKSTIQKRDARGIVRHGAEWLTIWSDPDSLKTAVEKRIESAAHRARIEIEQCMAAAARSVSGNPELRIVFDAAGRDAGLPALPALRGEIDSYALNRRFHSPAVHRELAPHEPSARRLFDLCEQVRCEARGARRFFGVRDNLVAHQMERLQRSNLLNAHLASLVPLAEGLRMVLRDALLESPEPSIRAQGFWMWDQWIRARFSADLHALRLNLGEQMSYASLALALIGGLLEQLGLDTGRQRLLEPTDRPGEALENGDDRLAAERMQEDQNGDLFQPGDLFLADHGRPLTAPPKDPVDEIPPPYSVFTTAHDRVARATELVDPATLRQARASLERRRADFRRDFARLVTRLQRKLLSRQTRSWSFDLDEGLIDASRLDRVVVNPGFASAYKQEQETEFRDSVVSILIDNSGSMRGKPIEIACLASDMISAALERCGVACEILGFTTGAWKGGDAAKDWARAGSPKDPGRLNGLLHIVYKAANEPVRRSRTHICAMLETSLLKENIDGEALLWASRRLLLRPESRKVLIVISDGAPMDQATFEHNRDKQILDRHLREVIAAIESAGAIDLTAIGVKHEIGRLYRNSIQIEKVENLGVSLVAMVDELLSAPSGRRRA